MPSHPLITAARRLRVATMIAASLIVLARGRNAAGDDPFEWRPPARKPDFRNLLKDSEYRRLAAPILNRLPRAQQEAATRRPDHGLKISGVFAPGALEAQGVTLNDVITKVNGEELWGRHTEWREDPVRVRVYSAGQDAFRELKVGTDLNHPFAIYRRPDLAYLRSADRKAAWDGDAFVALVADSRAPDLAETAWHRALAAGFPRNRLCLASGARLALAQGRTEAAADFWYEAEHHPGSGPLDPLLGYRVLVASGKLEGARDLARRHPKLLRDIAEGLETLVALYRARPAQERAAPSPSVQARGMHRRDARGDLIGLSPLAENTFLAQLTSRDIFHAEPASDHYTIVELQDPRRLGDFELRLTLTIAPADERRASYVKLVRLILGGALGGDDPGAFEAGLVGHVELEAPSGFTLRHCEPGDLVHFPDPLVSADGKTPHTVRFVRVGGQIEVLIDDRRVLYQPIRPDLRLQDLRFQVVGASVNVTEFALDELIPRI